MSIHQEVTFSAPPATIFEALFTSEGHAAFTGAPASIEPVEGGAWSAYGGGITGRTIEVVDGQRLVQAWRAGNWPEGVYSLVRFELTPTDDGTRVTLDHTGYPEGSGEHLGAGWHERYWTPLSAWLAR